MSIYKAFSLTEALITLLIVCIITIVSVPVITKKARKTPSQSVWITDTRIHSAITPNGHKDVSLGDASGNSQQGIIVVNKLYFKDRKGNVIGWIAEDGSTSFAQGNNYDFNAMSQRQQKLEETLAVLTGMLREEIHNQNKSPNTGVHRQNKYKSNINDEELNAQIQELLKILQSQQTQ